MGHRREQDEAGDTRGKVERAGGRERARPGMADDDGARNAELCQGFIDQRRLPRRRGVGHTARAIAEPVAGPIDQDHAPLVRERHAEGEALVFEIAARSVQQHDRRIVRLRPDLDDVKRSAGHRHEPAGGTMRTLEKCEAKRRAGGADKKDCDDEETDDEHRTEIRSPPVICKRRT